MPLSTSFAGLSARALGMASSALKKIYDNWVSGTPRSLGTSTSGTPWTVVQGAWTASGGGTAATSTAASSYPFATVPLHQNVQSSIQSAVPGSGLVFWETDAGDWWASIVNATTATVATGSYCISNSCCTGSNTCVANSCCSCDFAMTKNNGTVICNATLGTPYCSGTWSDGSGSCGACNYNNCCTGSNTCVSNSCCSIGYTYTTYYYWGLAIIKSVASAISTVAHVTLNSVTSTGAMIQSLSLSVIGGNISAQAYSDASLTTPDGSALTTTGTPGGTNVGIMVAPTDTSAATAGSAYNQGSSVGQFSAQ